MALFSSKSRVHGRLILKGDTSSKIEGWQVMLAFVPAQPGNPPLKKLFEPHIAGSCIVLSLAKLEYELELDPGHYQLFARCRRAAIDGPRLDIDERFFDLTPLAKAVEVKKGQALFLNLPLTMTGVAAQPPTLAAAPGTPSAPRPNPSAPGDSPFPSFTDSAPRQGNAPARPKHTPLRIFDEKARAVALVWATDDRIHVHPWKLRPGIADRLGAQVPPNSRRAFDIAQNHMVNGRVSDAMFGYKQALDSFVPSLHGAVPEWLLDLKLAIARNLTTTEGCKEALAMLQPHFSRNKSLAVPLPTAVEVLGITAAAASIYGELDLVERLVIQMLAMVLRGEGARDNEATAAAVEYRKKALKFFVSRAEPERLLEYLDKETPLLGDPSGQLAGGMARFEALVKLGRGAATVAFGRKLLNNLETDGSAEAQEAIGKLRKELRDVIAMGDANAINSSAAGRRPQEVAHAEKIIASASAGRIDLLEQLAKSHPGKFDLAAGGFRTGLMMAAAAGQLAAVKWLAEHGAKPGLTSSDSRNALLLASEGGHAEVVHYLLGKGLQVDHRDGSLQTALHLAAANNRANAVRALLEASPPLDARDVAGDTPLTLCAQRDTPEVVEVLVTAGADPNQKIDDGITPLMKAARFGQVRTVQALLDGGADKSVQDDGGRRAFDWATRAQQPAAAKLVN